MDTSATAFEQLVRGFLGSASKDMEAEMGAPFDSRVLNVIDLAQAGEGVVGLEILSENLDEYEIELTEGQRRALLAFADEWNLGDRYRRLIESLRSA
jgi:hypothetical protein